MISAMQLRQTARTTLPRRPPNSFDGASEKNGSNRGARVGSQLGRSWVLSGSDLIAAPQDVALVSLRENLNADARSWFQIACSESEITELPGSLTLAESNMSAPFDIRLVFGENAQQLVGWLVKSGEYLEWRPSIAALSSSTPEDRAYLLRCGFDDVFDIAEMEPTEGLLRISGIWSGFCRYQATVELERKLDKELRRMSSDGHWTWQQRKFLVALLNSPGGFVRYDELGAQVAMGSSISKPRYLKVVASAIRKKLVAGYSLESIRHRGYLLSFEGERIDSLI